jgi:glycosyltransferase involved in cell wall biosynthesis
MKPRVLQLVDSFHQGGTERQAVQLIRALVGTGRYEVTVACLNKEGALLGQLDDLNLGEINGYSLNSFYDLNFLRQVRRLARQLRRQQIQILQTHDFYTNIIGMTAGWWARVPVRIAGKRETGGLRSPRQEMVERRAFARAHAIVVNAGAVGQFLSAAGVPAAKLTTIYNGVDVAPPLTDTDATLVSLGITRSPGAPVVTIVANLRHEVKDQETFLRAAARVRAEIPNAVFVLAGEGERIDLLKAYAAERGLGDAAIFTGRCTRVPELLSASDIGILSSSNEGFSNAILEYMAAGLPVVTTDVGGVREAVVEGESGFIVPVADDELMASRLLQLLNDKELRRRFGARGQAIVAAKFSLAARLRQTETLYAELLGRNLGGEFATVETGREVAGQVPASELFESHCPGVNR